MGNLNFDATDVPPAESFQPLPTGWYGMRIIGLEMRTSSNAAAGEMLSGELEILDDMHPDYAGRKAHFNLCINHANQQPREIARRQMSAICHATGRLQVSDTGELLGESIRVRLVAVPAKDGYDARSEVRGFKALTDEAPEEAAKPAAAAEKPKGAAKPAATKTSGTKPGWKR